MATEPERKIAELLRAYAQKRRAEAGDHFALHPATRRLLQSEVARLHPESSPSGSWLQIFSILWVRAGLACSILLVLGLVVWSLHPWDKPGREFAANSSAPKSSTLSTTPDEQRTLPASDSAKAELPVKAPAIPGQLASRATAQEQLAENGQVSPSAPAASRSEPTIEEAPGPLMRSLAPMVPAQKSIPLPAAPSGTSQTEMAARKKMADSEFSLAEKENRDKAAEINKDTPLNKPSATAQADQTLRDLQRGASMADARRNEQQPGSIGGFGGNLAGKPSTSSVDSLKEKAQPSADASAGNRTLGAARPLNSPATQLAYSYGATPRATPPASVPAREDGTRGADRSQAAQGTPLPALGAINAQLKKNANAAALEGNNLFRDRFANSVLQHSTGLPSDTRSPLDSFVLERSGNRVRIVDADGSIYDGELLSTTDNNVAVAGARVDLSKGAVATNVPFGPNAEKLRQLGLPSSPTTFTFRAAGTNLTLSQPITIQAQLQGIPETPPTAQTAPSTTLSPATPDRAKAFTPAATSPVPPVSLQQSLTVSKQKLERLSRESLKTAVPVQVEGKARIGNDKEIQIKAVRIAP